MEKIRNLRDVPKKKTTAPEGFGRGTIVDNFHGTPEGNCDGHDPHNFWVYPKDRKLEV